jgi:Protein of unknown function (DUF3011)
MQFGIGECSMGIFRLACVVWLSCGVFALGAMAQTGSVSCASSDGLKKYCALETKGGAHLVKQTSEAECKQGESWGYDEKGLWVDHGCGGEFAAGVAAPAAGGKVLTCSSDGGKIYCDASTGRGVQLVKQRSAAPCKQGDSWGYDGLGIWVDRGCSADFQLGVTPRAPADSGDEANAKRAADKTCLQQVGKARSDQMVKQCLQVSMATHPPCNVQNSCELITDEIRRNCQLLGRDGPSFCAGYVK